MDHGGHGTTMRALSHGLPMVGIPAKGADKVSIMKLLEQWKVGRALPGDADARAFVGLDGEHLAAASVDALISPDRQAGATPPL